MVHHPLVAELDAPTLVLVLLVSLATVAVMTGQARLRALLAVVTFELPVMISLVGAVSVAGALRLRDIVSAQGGLPWEWSAFRSPPSFLLFLALLAAAMKERILGAPGSDRAASRTLAAAEQLHLYLLSGLAAAVFLGGWTLPWLAPGAEAASAPYAALASAVFVVKTHMIVQLVLRGRRAMCGVEIPVLISTFWRRVIPLAALSLGACLMWGRLGLHPEVEALVAVLDVVLLALLAGRLVLRVRRPEPELRLNPFL
jgi:NADH:ubiquinone oxidoreductase subunit H